MSAEFDSAKLRPAAFLDRDGVLNRDHGHVYRMEDFEWIAGSLEAMARLQAAGYALVIVTNQAGIAKGYYSGADYERLCAAMHEEFARRSLKVKIYHCPHHPSEGLALYKMDCDCRKPRPGMLLRAGQELGLDLKRSLLVGDKLSDIQAARAAGLGRAYLVRSGHALGAREGENDGEQADGIFDDLSAVVHGILERE